MWLDSRLPLRRAGFESHVTPEVNVDFYLGWCCAFGARAHTRACSGEKERKEEHISPGFLPTAGLIHNEKAAICARKRPLWSFIPAGPVSGSRLMLHHYKNHLQQRPTGACADSIRQFPDNASMEALIFSFRALGPHPLCGAAQCNIPIVRHSTLISQRWALKNYELLSSSSGMRMSAVRLLSFCLFVCFSFGFSWMGWWRDAFKTREYHHQLLSALSMSNSIT